MAITIPLKIHSKGSGPSFCSYKTGRLRKNLQNDWVPRIFCPYKMVGPCASTTSFQHPSILYGGILSPDVRSVFFLSMKFSCILGPCAPKKAPFCKNLFLYHLPSFFSSVIPEQPILFVRKWAQWYVRPIFCNVDEKWSVHIPVFLPRINQKIALYIISNLYAHMHACIHTYMPLQYGWAGSHRYRMPWAFRTGTEAL